MLKPTHAKGTLDHAWIAAHIPHQGAMCLLDRVEYWDETNIRCRSASHRHVDNPLRDNGRLGAACGIEYAAQVMAVHGALLADPGSSRPRSGYLVSVRNVRFEVARLDDLAADLQIRASCSTHSATTSLYEFSLSAEGQLLVSGRALVVLDSDSLAG